MRALFMLGVTAAVVVLAGAARAEGVDVKGSTVLAIQLARGDGDFADVLAGPDGPIMRARDHSDVGVQAQVWHFLKPDYAWNVSGGIGFFKETDETPTGEDEREYRQPTWHIRVGGDRVAHITNTFHIFAGPGIELWRGHATIEQLTPSGEVEMETPWTTRIALSGRLAFHVKMGPNVGLMGQIGQYFGRARATDDATDLAVTWWPSGTQGGAGLALNF